MRSKASGLQQFVQAIDIIDNYLRYEYIQPEMLEIIISGFSKSPASSRETV